MDAIVLGDVSFFFFFGGGGSGGWVLVRRSVGSFDFQQSDQKSPV